MFFKSAGSIYITGLLEALLVKFYSTAHSFVLLHHKKKSLWLSYNTDTVKSNAFLSHQVLPIKLNIYSKKTTTTAAALNTITFRMGHMLISGYFVLYA